MSPAEAVMKLSRIGFCFRLDGEAVKVRYDGPGKPDPVKVPPLLEVARRHKDAVRFFLKCHCPRCGGVASCPDYEGRALCMRCDWAVLIELYPALRTRH